MSKPQLLEVADFNMIKLWNSLGMDREVELLIGISLEFEGSVAASIKFSATDCINSGLKGANP